MRTQVHVTGFLCRWILGMRLVTTLYAVTLFCFSGANTASDTHCLCTCHAYMYDVYAGTFCSGRACGIRRYIMQHVAYAGILRNMCVYSIRWYICLAHQYMRAWLETAWQLCYKGKGFTLSPDLSHRTPHYATETIASCNCMCHISAFIHSRVMAAWPL